MTVLNLLASAIGIGLVLTLILSEAFGLAAGGLVVPGYMALNLMQPLSFALTLIVALGAFAIVRALAFRLFVFGRRKTAMMIVTGYLLGAVVDLAFGGGVVFQSAGQRTTMGSVEAPVVELSVVGYIIPGLIALWFDRQGVLRTICGLMVTAVLVRLILVVFLPDALLAYEASRQTGFALWSRFAS